MRLNRTFVPAVVLSLAACSPPPGEDTAPSLPEGGASQSHTVLPWITDDYAAALAEAKARDLPLFVESWAPW
ncbi:MAG: hypothetical protein HKN12_02660 [Gemmatimonadetes bacterium]|nr:hypothetical protein [Gemmatimonadota bacterium]